MGRLLLFGRLQDIAGWRERPLGDGPVRLSALTALLAAEDPALGEALRSPSVAFALNGALRRDDPEIAPGDEAAFLPPMSGG